MDSNSTNEFISDTEKFFTKSEYQSDLSLTSLLGKLFIGFVLYSLTIWTIIGNIIVCVIVVTNRQLKQGGMSNFLIGNLALSDLLLGLTVLPFSATLSTFKTWLFGNFSCFFFTDHFHFHWFWRYKTQIIIRCFWSKEIFAYN